MALDLHTTQSGTLARGRGRVATQPVCLHDDRPRLRHSQPVARSSYAGPGVVRTPSLCQASSRSAAFGSPLPPMNPGRPRAGCAPCIHGAVVRRGNRVIISAVLAGVENAVDATSFLDERIKPEKNLVIGKLDNGLQYVILPNKLPPTRFEAHLEIHAGSVDELPTEQGIAHLVEHVTFLGSKRRENLLGTGARANAYTDFHHTVFHVHSPITNSHAGVPLLPQVLEALEEIAFKPEFLAARIEKERKAVMAEAQMMNTIEYRVDCQLLHYLHHENNLGTRFPIGKMDQVQSWSYEQLKAFWAKWYFPANATLYIVGDLDRDVEATKQLITRVFGKLAAPTLTAKQAQRLREVYWQAQQDLHPPAYVAQPPACAPLQPQAQQQQQQQQQQLLEQRSSAASPHSNGNGNGAHAVNGTSSHGNSNGNGNGHGSNGNGNGNGAALEVVEAQVVAPLPPGPAPASTLDGNTVLVKQRHPMRPPVAHFFGHGPIQDGEVCPAPVRIFRHPLMQHFSLTVFAKLPVVSLTHMRHMKNMLISRIILSVWQFRIARRYAAANAPFVKIELDISDSGREGCAVSTLAIKAEPRDWEGAVGVAVQEMRRLQRFGITKGELSRYLNAILRDSEQLARQVDKIPSLDTLNFVMESLACGHSVMSHVEAHEAMEKVAQTVTLEEVNQMARSVLAFGSDYGNEAGPLADAAQHPHRYSGLGPVRATSVVACLPAYTMESGLSVSTTLASANRKAPTGASAHIDADQVDLAELEAQSKQMDEIEIPEGAIKFDLSPTEIARVLSDQSHEVEPEEDIECPQHLIPPQVMDAKVAALQPAFVPLEGPGGQGPCLPDPDPHSGVVQRRLQNGVRINYKHTDNEPQSALMRLIVPGGRAAESMEKGPEGFGAVLVGTRALSESGGVGPWPREQVEVFCIANLINTALEADEENIVKDFHCSVSQGSLTATFELAHLFLTEPVWEEEAFRRAKAAWISNSQGIDKSLEGGTHERVMKAMMGAGKERRSRDPTEEEIEALDFERVKQRVTRLLHAGALEINIVGDVDAAELDRHLLRFIGTVPPADPALVQPFPHVTIPLQDPPFEARHSAWHLKDSDQRACAYIAGAAPARWGPMGNFDPLPPYPLSFDPPPMILPHGASPQQRQAATEARRRHPLFTSCVLMLLTEVINSRLFTTVRDSLGLTYDVSFEVTMFDIIRAGWFTVKVTSHPDKIYDALDASAAVLRDVTVSPINKRELDRARTTVLTRHESDMKDNVYWLGMVTHCQNPAVPWKSVSCLRDLKAMYVSLTVEDMYFAYSQLQLEDEHLYSCVGVSGKSTVQPPEERLVGGIGSSRREEWQEEAPGPLGGTLQGPSLAALFTAMTAALGVTNLKSAIEKVQPSKGPEGGR